MDHAERAVTLRRDNLFGTMKKQTKYRAKVYSLEKERDHLAMEERFLESAQEMLNREIDAAGECILLHQHQIPVMLSFREYLMNLATQPGGIQDPPFCRIVLPPRTGKTVIAGEIISQTGLCSAFVVPTKTLVQQTMQVLHTLLPGVPIGLYYGVEKRPVSNGVNITTYTTLQRHFFTDCLPAAVRRSALVFVDEAHHSMTELRLKTLHKAFDKKSIRLALTATPEEMLLRLEQINSLLTTLVFMDHRLQHAIIKRLGLFGESESTWYEIGRDLNVSRERARQIFLRALGILRKKHLRRTMFDRPIINSIEEYPELAQIVFGSSETFL